MMWGQRTSVWFTRFAWWPCRLQDGKWAWLEYVRSYYRHSRSPRMRVDAAFGEE